MRHPEVLISAYLDGELAPGEREALMAHLGECVRCTLEMRELQDIRASVRGLPVLELPPGLVPEADVELVPAHRNRGVWVGAAAAVVAVIIAVATILGPTAPTISVDDLNSRLGARVSLDPAFGPAKVIIPEVAK